MVIGVNVREYVKKDCVLFNSYCDGENVVLSNHYDKCVIDYQGVIFHSSEQLFFWILLEEDEVGRKKVMECETAKECLKKGRYYWGKKKKKMDIEEVQRKEVQALRLAIGEKMRCCKEFRDIVMKSGNKRIVEYSWWEKGDADYGCKDVDERYKYDWDRGVVRGQNICGRLIMEWREKYRRGEVA